MSKVALRYLIECRGECEYLDYKEELHLQNDHNKADFARDVLAMKNVGGGYLVVGVRDKTWDPVGLKNPFTHDSKQLRDVVRKASGLDLAIDVVTHNIFINDIYKDFALIHIRGSSKTSKLRNNPSICKGGFRQNEHWGIKDGEIYFRRNDETVRISSSELQNLILELIEQEDKSEIEQQKSEPSPFMIEDGLYRILPTEYENFVERADLQENLKSLIEGDARIWIINVYGPGGVGKSTLVSWLANHYYNTRFDDKVFDGILHLSAKDTQLTDRGIKQLRPTLYSLDNLIDNLLFLFDCADLVNEPLDSRKDLVQAFLSEYKLLLILDNMETVKDGRIMQFVSSLPPSNKSKVLLTSRLRTSGWEKPLQVSELSSAEVKKFLRIKIKEKKLSLPENEDTINKIFKFSGGLPLAIEWMVGQFALTGNLNDVLNQVPSQDSPLLDFSFNSSWKVLSKLAQKALAVLSIFDDAPTMHLWSIALELPLEKVEEAAAQLIEATFISEKTDKKTNEKTYHALPITKVFASNKLKEMPEAELTATIAYKRYLQQMELVAAEMQPFSHLFENFGVTRDTEKQAIILARRATSRAAEFDDNGAEHLFKDALDTDPRSTYVLVQYGLFKKSLGQIGEAIKLFEKAVSYVNKSSGFYVYYNFSQVYDKVKDYRLVEFYLEKALEYHNDYLIARHQLGVVKSRLGKYDESIKIFDDLIKIELTRIPGPTDTLAYAYKSKVMTLLICKKHEEAEFIRKEAINRMKEWPRFEQKIIEIQNL
ncbi:hypothetical protein KSZ_02730 [Dictyobacter formicarum]|uniref:AAA+ ATPase domain-containing protein n=2 Tax=Dictyobacter formicarum TaxID=2778368 RepID=A0ABQ3V8Q7_9CHLR|nr:hypothetical protein KSZ_02730 [Dictyobacter formicarum]